MKNKQRFQVSPVSDTYGSFRGESQLGVPELDVRRGSHTVQAIPSENDRRRSMAQWTREALPRLDHFRISRRAFKRPSLGELYGDPERKSSAVEDDSPPAGGGGHVKLGWIVGVVIPCLLNIWGVMLFLRLSWVVGQAGIAQTLIIIGISALVCVVTTLSLSAICTNGEVKGGGIYYIISRSLGPEFGASLGVVFAFANAVAASMNTIGFCDSLNDLLKVNGLKIIDNGVMDTRIVGSIALLVMVIICAVGMDWEAQAQNFLVVTIMIAILDFIIGTLIGPTTEAEIAEGFVGFSLETFRANWGPDYRFAEGVNQNFFTVFSIYFPSVTGIQAGANICGDLKDAASAIPKGTNIAVAFSMFSYAVFAVFAGGGALRDASGNVTDIINGTFLPTCVNDHSCKYGLQNSYSVMQLMSVWGGLIYAGCFAATLSTALTNLLSVPRLIQALGIDQIYPGFIFFSKGYGKHGEPYRGYVLTFIISLTFLLIADLNAIAPLISTFYLASYALINFCTFHAALVQPLGWRPTFRFYNKWLSLFGCILCVVIMFLMNYVSSLITFAIILALYLVVVYRKPDVNWGSTTQEQIYKSALTSAQKLQGVSDHVKNYHPQVLVLAGRPLDRPPLIDLAHLITKHHSLLMVGQVTTNNLSYRTRVALTKEAETWFEARKIKAFYNLVDGLSFEEGVRALVQASGFGKLSPNIILMGYKADWRICPEEELLAYFNVLDNAFDNRMAVTILRLPNGLDYSDLNTQINQVNGIDNPNFQDSNLTNSRVMVSVPLGTLKQKSIMHADSNLNIDITGSHTSINIPVPQKWDYTSKACTSKNANKDFADNAIVYSTRGGSAVPKEILDNLNVFNRKQGKGTIDVWWLYDDGGLTILLPYILSTRSNWSQCKIRVFALSNRKRELEVEERNMANLLSKLRIDYSSLTMLQGITDKPKNAAVEMHEELINGFREGQRESGYIPETELKALEEKTNRQLRLREMLLEHSSQANLIIMSLPMPRRGSVSAPLYMSWLEVLTRDMPPLVLVRGNQQNVLTFYS